jgi:hypothetical protein
MSDSQNSNLQSLLNRPVTQAEFEALSKHEMKVMRLLSTLSGSIKGFPDSDRKLLNVAKAWARFMSLEPYHVTFNSQVEAYMSEEEKARYMWKEGVIPGEWLVRKIADTEIWMPTPVEARKIYCDGGFPPLDGQMPALPPSEGGAE